MKTNKTERKRTIDSNGMNETLAQLDMQETKLKIYAVE